VTGSLAVSAELEVDGTLRVDDGALVQSGLVSTPGDSGGAFVSQGSGLLSLSNVTMGRGLQRQRDGHDPLRGRPQPRPDRRELRPGRVARTIGNNGVLDLQTGASTGALTFSGFGTRQGNGQLTVGSGQSELGQATFSGGGVTAFSLGSQVTIDDTSR
jgi:hypothetical protein